MRKRDLEDRIEKFSTSENGALWEETVFMAMEKKIPMYEMAPMFFFREDIEAITQNWENPMLKIKGFFLLQIANCSDVVSDAGLKELEEITSNFLTTTLSEIPGCSKEDMKKWEKIFKILFESEDFIKEYDNSSNKKIDEFNRGILLSLFTNNFIRGGNDAVIKNLQSLDKEIISRLKTA